MISSHKSIEGDRLLTGDDDDLRRKNGIETLRKRFWWFSLIASLNHALNYVVTAYATSLLAPQLGGIILGLSWTLNSVSGLTIATPCVQRFGYKISMIISFAGYTFQIATLYFAIISSDNIAWPIAIVGSVVSGLTSAIWWTAQGVCFESTCGKIEEFYPPDPIILRGSESKQDLDFSEIHNDLSAINSSSTLISSMVDTSESNKAIRRIRANLSAHWTIIYQCADIVVFLSLSVIPIFAGVSIPSVIAGLAVLGVVTTFLGFTFESYGDESENMTWVDLKESIAAVPIQFRDDARASLIAPFVFGFGITTAMFAYFVNDDVVSQSSNLGEVYLGFLEAWSYFVAVLSAYPYKFISKSCNAGQDFVIQFGSLSFMLSGLLVLCLSDAQLSTWASILCVKGLYGLGRGVFEGSCRAVYAQMFAGKDLATAFSAQTLLAGLSGGVCFFLFGVLTKDAIAAITVGNGILALCTYFVLSFVIDPNTPISWSALLKRCCCGFGCYGAKYNLKGDLSEPLVSSSDRTVS